MSRHGRAELPFGKFRGMRVSMLPNDYLAWLLESLRDPKWHWLLESVQAELRHRGFEMDNFVPEPQPVFKLRCMNCQELFDSSYQRPLCESCKAIKAHGYQTLGNVLIDDFLPRPRRQIVLDDESIA